MLTSDGGNLSVISLLPRPYCTVHVFHDDPCVRSLKINLRPCNFVLIRRCTPVQHQLPPIARPHRKLRRREKHGCTNCLQAIYCTIHASPRSVRNGPADAGRCSGVRRTVCHRHGLLPVLFCGTNGRVYGFWKYGIHYGI